MSPARSTFEQRLAQLVAERVPFVRATVVRAKRPTSANPGDTALVLEDGSIEGFVGGSCAEATIRRFGLEALQSGEPLLLRISPDQVGDGDLVEGAIMVGNPCLSGGELEVFLEPRRPAPRVVVLGDTPIGHNVVVLGRELGYDIMAVDGDSGDVEALVGAAAVVVASHGRDEESVLTAALRAQVPYVALVASRKRAAAVLASLDVTPEQRDSVRAPAGLDIGAHTPGEVALSILAEVVASVRGGGLGAGSGAGGGAPDAASARGAGRAGGAASESARSAGSNGGSEGEAGAAVDGVTLTKKNERFQAVYAVDPSCGMTVAAVDSSRHSDVTGERQWFCSGGCQAAFENEHSASGAG